MIRRGLRTLRFLVGFGVARGVLFVAPIVMANLLPIERYGQFELAQAYASIGTLVVGCGLIGTVPLIRLREEIKARWDTLQLLVLILAGICIGLALLLAIGAKGLYTMHVLVPLGTGVLLMQGLWANTLKSHGRSTSAVFVDAGFWIASVAGAGVLVSAGGGFSAGTITLALMLYAAVLLAVTLSRFKQSYEGAFFLADLLHNIALGLPLMFTGVLTVLITSSGRLILGPTSGVEAVGIYAIIYRATTLPLVGHQMLIIGFFRQIFSWSDEVLRDRAVVIVFGVSATVMAFWGLEPWIGWMLGQRFVKVIAAYRTEGLFLLIQTILWSAIALNDLINSRLQIAGRVTVFTGPYLLIGLLVLASWTSSRAQAVGIGDTLQGFVLGHFCLMAGFYAMQCTASWLLGHRLIRLWLTVLACTAGTGLLIFLGEHFS